MLGAGWISYVFVMPRLPGDREEYLPYVAGSDAVHLLMTIMNSLHLHETAKDAPVLYRKACILPSLAEPLSVSYVESKTWKAPSSASVYKEISWFVPIFLLALSVATIYRLVYRRFLILV